jgi:hypothetical protein
MARAIRKTGSVGGGGVGGTAAHEAVRKRLQNKFTALMHWPSDLYRSFPTDELRSAFQDLEPDRFYLVQRFYPSDYPPPNDVFTRDQEQVMDYIEAAEYRYAAPDLTAQQMKHDNGPLRRARAEWWIANRLPLTDAERVFISEHLPELVKPARKCPKEKETKTDAK